MKDHVEISHLTKFHAFRVNRDQVMDLEHGSKSIQTSLMLRQRPPKPYKLLNFFMISVIHLKWVIVLDLHLSFFQMVAE